MATISLTLPSDGQTIDASDVNNPFNTIANEINGNLDNSNIKAGAAIDRSKIAGFSDGWENLNYAPSSVTYNGNRSYDLTFSSVNLTTNVSNGMRLKLPRTVTPPTQCAILDGSGDYFNRTSASVNGMTFTDDFAVSAWVKLSSYGADMAVVARKDGTDANGWDFRLNSSGQVMLVGLNAGTGNYSYVQSYQSIPLNKWVHIAAQLDMSTFTATTTTSYVMIDGVNAPALVSRAGTNPTSLVNTGDLAVGRNGSQSSKYFAGKIAQVAIYSAKVTQANIKATISQGLTGSETSLISAYSFNNTINDLNTTNANNLTANGGAVATSTDSPFNATEYGIITANSYSTNTTLTVQVPEGYALPTTGGIGTSYFSTQKVPYGFPGQRGKWQVILIAKSRQSKASPVASTWYNGYTFNIPAGSWYVKYAGHAYGDRGGAGTVVVSYTLSTTTSTDSDTSWNSIVSGAAVTSLGAINIRDGYIELTTAAPYYMNYSTSDGTMSNIYFLNDISPLVVTADNAYL
jgi:hypothetical protein